MKKEQIVYFLILVIVYSCVNSVKEEKQLKETIDLLKVNEVKKLPKGEKINEEKAVLERENEALKKTDSLNNVLSDFTSYVYTIFPNDTVSKYASIPFILQSKNYNFTVDQYPDILTLRLIPNSIDTLEVITGSSDCSNCLGMLKIQTKNEHELYYAIKQHNKIVIEKGEIDSVLKERSLSKADLENDSYIFSEYDNWKNYSALSENINQKYILATDLNWIENPKIQDINTQLNNELNTSLSLDSLKTMYQNKIKVQQQVTFDNLLFQEEKGYSHSGGFSKEIHTTIHLQIESIDIMYISAKNDIYVVEWIKDYKEVLDDVGAPFDDNYVAKKEGNYQINKWDDNSMIALFHPKMLPGDYLVVYEVKLKNLESYIQSPLNIINYR